MVVADLHVHTTNSDGSLTLETLPDAADAAGVSTVAVTDHDRLHPGLSTPVATVGGVGSVPHLVATLGVSGFIYAFFAHLVLPRRGRGTYEERATAVRGQWLRSVVVFGATVAAAVPAATSAL